MRQQLSDGDEMSDTTMRIPTYDELYNPEHYSSKNILISYLAPRDAYRPILFSSNEVFCGPDTETVIENGVVKTIKTEAGLYDIQDIVQKLPEAQKPELFVVKTDATCRNLPVNTKSLNIPRVLVLGDSHHLQMSIRTLIDYALQEEFDFITSDHDRHHLHYFVEAGFKKVFWSPMLNIYPRPQPHCFNNEKKISFVGQVGKWHPYRCHIIDHIKNAQLPLSSGRQPHSDAAATYAKSAISLNCSLNGDLNLRVFEVISSGGFLLTDTLHEESGLELILKKGVHYDDYRNEKELIEKAQYYLNNPEQANNLAEAGLKQFWSEHDPRVKVQQLMNYINEGQLDDRYKIYHDKRSLNPAKSLNEIKQRVSKYEFIQELQLKQIKVNILQLTDDNLLTNDISDLTRVDLHRDKNEAALWDSVIITDKQIEHTDIASFINENIFKSIIIDGGFNIDVSNTLLKHGYEHADSEFPGIYTVSNPAILGQRLLEKGNTNDALKCFTAHVEKKPDDIQTILNIAEFYASKNLSTAKPFFEHVLSCDRFHRRALEALIEINITNNNIAQATLLLEDAVQGNPENALYCNTLADFYIKQNLFEKAFSAYTRSLSLEENQPQISAALTFLTQKGIPPAKSNYLESKKIILFTNLFPPQEFGGYGRLMFDFANMLRDRGHRVKVLTANAPNLGKLPEREPHVTRKLKLFGSWSDGGVQSFTDEGAVSSVIKANLSEIDSFIDRYNPDLCIAGNMDLIGWQGIELFLDKSIPVIHHLGNRELPYEIHNTPKSDKYRLATCSRWLGESLKKDGYPLKTINVVYPGAKFSEFMINSEPNCSKLKIAYASILQPYKGPHVLIEALAIMHAQGINFSCTLAGTSTDTQFINELKTCVKENGFSEKVSFVGNLSRDGLKKLYATHNVLAFPSVFNEPFGISQVEAMSAGIPVIGSDADGCKEVIADGQTGFICEKENARELAEALVRLSQDEQRWRQMGKNAQERARDLFDIERSVDILEKTFAELL